MYRKKTALSRQDQRRIPILKTDGCSTSSSFRAHDSLHTLSKLKYSISHKGSGMSTKPDFNDGNGLDRTGPDKAEQSIDGANRSGRTEQNYDRDHTGQCTPARIGPDEHPTADRTEAFAEIRLRVGLSEPIAHFVRKNTPFWLKE